MNKRIVITGATGLVGSDICRKLYKKGDNITVFTRNVNKGKSILPFLNNFVEWDYNKPEKWRRELEGKDVIIHLAGANLFDKRWNNDYKRKIMNSRIDSTKNLINSISLLKSKPKLFISSSAVGYYGNKGNEELTEESEPGTDFLALVCKEWEAESKEVEKFGIRRVNIRMGIVLSTKEGALKKMLLPFRLFAGGTLGNGDQWFPWIHIDDIVRIYLFAIENEISGAINGASPNPVRMKEFANTLGKVLNRPSFFSVPEFLLKIFVGEGAESILSSLRVIPQKLIKSSYKFKYENLETALTSLL
jgi:uncharacterized protein (TIGR01777 family)